jgi:hypothetical protein
MVEKDDKLRRCAISRHRRALLGAFMTLAVSPAMAPLVAAAVPEGLRGRLMGLVADPDTARRLGRLHLAAGADPARLQALLEALAAAPGSEPVRALLDAKHRACFAAGDVVIVDGWVLARTEAEILALIALV